MHNRTLGVWGERLAAKHILETGGFILGENCRYAEVEIDVLFEKKGVLVVCEVKTRTSLKLGHPFEVIDIAKFTRLQLALQEAMRVHKSKFGRIDVIGIVLRPQLKIQHIEGISF